MRLENLQEVLASDSATDGRPPRLVHGGVLEVVVGRDQGAADVPVESLVPVEGELRERICNVLKQMYRISGFDWRLISDSHLVDAPLSSPDVGELPRDLLRQRLQALGRSGQGQ